MIKIKALSLITGIYEKIDSCISHKGGYIKKMTRKNIVTRNYTFWEYNTKDMKERFNSYRRSTDSELWEVYGNYSSAKINAMRYCHDLMEELNGWALRIVSHNIMQFTAGFMFEHPETGELYFCYITKSYNRYIKISDEVNY